MSDLETLLNELEKLDEYNKSQPASYRMAPDNDKLSSLIKATRVMREALTVYIRFSRGSNDPAYL